MRRRFLLRGSALAALVAPAALAAPKGAPPAPTSDLTIRWLGHTCFLFASRQGRILVNPFRPAGCTAGYRKPDVDAELILLSSRLLDEGALDVVRGNPRVLYQPGVFTVDAFDKIQGIRTLHDRKDGRQFGINVAWRWRQAGIDMVHLGGIAAPLDDEAKILLGKPDVLFVPVGGGDKSFDATLAREATEALQPTLVIPTQYRTRAAEDGCELAAVDTFVKLFNSEDVRVLTTPTLSVAATRLPKGTSPQVRVLGYDFVEGRAASR
jgi:L-ascorbate metabolism protein UlaG (beta-lactamase superfamily)